jgi:restriction endonuclease Mrr
MSPVLRATADGADPKMKDIVAALARDFGLTTEELDTRLQSGTQSLFADRLSWAATLRSRPS